MKNARLKDEIAGNLFFAASGRAAGVKAFFTGFHVISGSHPLS